MGFFEKAGAKAKESFGIGKGLAEDAGAFLGAISPFKGGVTNTPAPGEDLSVGSSSKPMASAGDRARHDAAMRLSQSAIERARGGEGDVAGDIQRQAIAAARRGGVGIGMVPLALNQAALMGAGARTDAALRAYGQEKEVLTGTAEQRQVTWDSLQQKMEDLRSRGRLTEEAVLAMLTGDPWIDDKLRAAARNAPGGPSLAKAGGNIFGWVTGIGRG